MLRKSLRLRLSRRPWKKSGKAISEKRDGKTSIEIHKVSVRLACELFLMSATCYRYQSQNTDENALIADWLIKLTNTWRNWGFGLCFLYLRNVKGFRLKPKKRIVRDKPETLAVPDRINEVWSVDFMHDQLSNQRNYRLFNILDDHNREGLAIEAGYSLPCERVIRSLDQLIELRGMPKAIRCDNGPEYISCKLQKWVKDLGIDLRYTQPGNPQENAYIERFNRTVRYDLLNQELFDSIAGLQEKTTNWLWHYNNERPNMALGGYPRKIY